MSRTLRDSQRRLDHIHGITFRDKFYNNPDGTMSYTDRPYRTIVRHGNNRKYYAAMKKLRRHQLVQNRRHDMVYGHHTEGTQQWA